MPFEQLLYRSRVANIHVVMFIIANIRDQVVARFFRGSFAPKIFAHVVVDPENTRASLAKRRTVSEPINPAEPVTMIVNTCPIRR